MDELINHTTTKAEANKDVSNIATDVTKALTEKLATKVEIKKQLQNLGPDIEAVLNFFDSLEDQIKEEGERRLKPYEEM